MSGVQPIQPLPYILSKDDVKPTILRHIGEHRNLLDELWTKLETCEPTFENIIKPLEELANSKCGEVAVIWALKYFSTDVECQAAGENAEKLWQEYYGQQKQRLYDLACRVAKKEAESGKTLDPESQRVLDKMILEGQDTGSGRLDEETLQCRRERQNRRQDLCADMNRNLREYEGGEWFLPSELDGVPLKDREGVPSDEKEGKQFFKHRGKYSIIMKNAHSSKTRRRMRESQNAGLAENGPIFREIMLLRDESARELGFHTHAETKLPYRCVESVEWVEKMLDQITEKLLPTGKLAFEKVHNKKKEFLRAGLGKRIQDPVDSDLDENVLMGWEIMYYDNLIEEEKKKERGEDTSEASIEEYFPLQHTIDAVMAFFAEYLQLHFIPIPQDEARKHIWHEDVTVWTVWDEREGHKGDFIGYLFADLLSRPNKYKGFQSVNLQPVRKYGNLFSSFYCFL